MEALRKMVPLECGDGDSAAVAAALEYVLFEVLRRHPFTPDGVWPQGVHATEIAIVGYADGWACNQQPEPPRAG
eukprot:gene11406-8958_t